MLGIKIRRGASRPNESKDHKGIVRGNFVWAWFPFDEDDDEKLKKKRPVLILQDESVVFTGGDIRSPDKEWRIWAVARVSTSIERTGETKIRFKPSDFEITDTKINQQSIIEIDKIVGVREEWLLDPLGRCSPEAMEKIDKLLKRMLKLQ